MHLTAMTIEDDGVRKVFLPVVRAYRSQGVAIGGITAAIADGDIPTVRRYERMLTRAGTKRQAEAERFMDVLRRYMSGEEIDKLLAPHDQR